jgi:hypothetical protein
MNSILIVFYYSHCIGTKAPFLFIYLNVVFAVNMTRAAARVQGLVLTIPSHFA